MASNVIAYLAKTDVAYSIALTSCATLLAPLLTPGLIFFYAHTQIDIPFLRMVKSIVLMVLLPLIIGLLIRRSHPKQIGRIDFVFPALSSFSIILICSTIIALNQEKIFSLSILLFTAVILHNAAGYLFGYQAGRLFRFDTRMKKTLSIEVGMQNAGMGAVLALNHFDAETALIPAVFAVWCVITASILAEFWRRMN
jgi:BASS family bile acid:Na+ symporter